ncbi:MAG TPA: hypothetical protein VF178_08075 [Gemmatimonadaceae bacterium]
MPTYRIRRYYRRPDPRPRGYRGTLEVTDNDSGELLARCDLTGRAALTVLTIIAADGVEWRCTPNRKVLPTQWTVTAVDQVELQFDARYLSAALNPLSQSVLSVLDDTGELLFHVVDPRSSPADRLIGSGPRDWMFMRDDVALGKITPLRRPQVEAKGFLSKVRAFLVGSDTGVVSFGPTHVLPAPAALALVAIHEELADASTE